MYSTRKILAAAFALGISFATSATLQAQQAPEQAPEPRTQSPPVAPPPAAAIDEKDIAAYAAAASEVRKLNRKWVPQVQAATKQGPEEANRVRDEALTEMTDAVKQKGISVQRYNEIYELAQVDPELNRQVLERIEQHER